MEVSSSDAAMRKAAFERVSQLQQTRNQLLAEDLKAGFVYRGERLPLVNPQRGIFKPRQMEALLSIKTVFPRIGNRIWYDDQRQIHEHIDRATDTVEYSFMGTDPNAADNRWLKEAMDRKVPIIYFIGTSPGRYQAVMPAFIVGWDSDSLKAQVALSNPIASATEYHLPAAPPNAEERRYSLRLVKQRLHQASFRDAVVAAYGTRCAFSGLPEPLLLDAAHIISDKDVNLGQPIVRNGIPLSKIHHAAFDAHLIGVDADYKIHIAKRLLGHKGGSFLESIKCLNGTKLRLPRRPEDHPDRERLEIRFKQFAGEA